MKTPNIEELKKSAKIRTKNLQQKRNKQDNIGPQEFRIGDDIDHDPTEGFESVEGENDKEKKKYKQQHKKAKEAFKSKVKNYEQQKAQNITHMESMSKTSGQNQINPKEFILHDSGSQAVDDGFAEKEKPSYAENSESHIEKSIGLNSFTEPQENEIASEISITGRTHTTEAINPEEFRIKDDISRFDEKDFSNNSQSNYAKGINKNIKRQKKLEQKFEKKHDTKLNKDLDIHSEQSVRLGGNRKKRPKTAYKEVHKADEPGVGEIAIPVRRQAPITQEKEIELARRKLFKKLKNDKMKKK